MLDHPQRSPFSKALGHLSTAKLRMPKVHDLLEVATIYLPFALFSFHRHTASLLLRTRWAVELCKINVEEDLPVRQYSSAKSYRTSSNGGIEAMASGVSQRPPN